MVSAIRCKRRRRFIIDRMTGKKAFGQGNDVDRSRPHVFHRDYWTLRRIREGLEDFINEHAAELKSKRALDFGSGESPYAMMMRDAGIDVIPSDIDGDGTKVIRIHSDGKLELQDRSVDVVFSTQVLEHVADVDRYLAEAFRVLRPGGLIFLSTHGAFVLHRHPTDFRRWTIDGLTHEITQAGFKMESIRPRIGILAMSTHLRSITIGGITRRIPGTGWLRPIIYLLANARMGLEEMLTPASVMEAHPELLIAVARRPV